VLIAINSKAKTVLELLRKTKFFFRNVEVVSHTFYFQREGTTKFDYNLISLKKNRTQYGIYISILYFERDLHNKRYLKYRSLPLDDC
jgi:hypothetical protein